MMFLNPNQNKYNLMYGNIIFYVYNYSYLLHNTSTFKNYILFILSTVFANLYVLSILFINNGNSHYVTHLNIPLIAIIISIISMLKGYILCVFEKNNTI